MSKRAHQPYSPLTEGWGKRGIGDMPVALPPAPHADSVRCQAQCDTQWYSRRQVGLGVQRPLDWQALAGSPSSRNPGRQLYRTTEPTHQSLPYTTELKSASGRPQFTGDREVPMGIAGLAACAACLAERQPKGMHPEKVAGPGRGPGCWVGSVGAPSCVPLWPEDWAAGETPHVCAWHKTCPPQAGCAKPCSLPQGPPPPQVSVLWLYLGRRTCSPASSSCHSHTGSSSAPCASPCSPPRRWVLCQTSKYPGLLGPQGARQSWAGAGSQGPSFLPAAQPAETHWEVVPAQRRLILAYPRTPAVVRHASASGPQLSCKPAPASPVPSLSTGV